MKADIINTSGTKTGKQIELNDAIFGIEPNDHAIYLSVKQYLANQRQGTHKAKEKGEVAGSTRKLHKQKGTGGARKGSSKNPLYKSGGTIFGPKPRDYSFKLNKKVKALARKSALSYKLKENSLMIVEDFNMEKPKTKEYQTILKNLGADSKRSLLVLSGVNSNVMLSGRNIEKAEVMVAKALNTYAIMKANYLILSESSVAEINHLLNQE